MKRRYERNERGFIPQLALALLGCFGVVAVTWGGMGLYDVATYNLGKEKETENRPSVSIPKIGPELPNAAEARECVLEYARDTSGYITHDEAKGWVVKNIPPPALTGNYARDNAAVLAWRREMDHELAERVGNWITQCTKAPEQPSKPQEPKPPADINGNYVIDVSGDNTCPFFQTNSGQQVVFTVNKSGGTVTLTYNGGRFVGAIDESNSFEASAQEDGVTGVMRGQFAPFADSVLLRNGSVRLTVAGMDCDTTFTGEKQR